jgi:hypothetical protein
MKTILELNHSEARQFFLKQESYCSIELPEYFVFNKLLSNISAAISGSLSSNQLKEAKSRDDLNYTFYYNKDGKFAWRPLQIINPAIYVYLVHKITTQDNWEFMVKRFNKFQENQQIKCYSIPSESEEENKSDKANQVTNWWNTIEQQSLELALQYEQFLNTDITDCYGSIYTHTITWALHDKETVKKDVVAGKKSKPQIYIGNDIDITLQSMQYAQTNGIPQGSVLMDFIAEMVLGYADLLLSNKIQEAKIEEYQILRYRDDYRIFTNSQEDTHKIAKFLTEVLIGLNLKLNSNKTFTSTDIIQDAVKPDKLYWLGSKKGEKTLQKTLLLIHSLAKKYPNSGSVVRTLSDFQKRLYKMKDEKIERENLQVLISIVVDLAYKNPKTYPMATAVLSKLLSHFENDEIITMISSIETKFNKIPNVGHLQIWLQRLTIKIDQSKEYTEKLCQKVLDNRIQIWNIDWLNDKIKKIVTNTQIIDTGCIYNMDFIMTPEEVQLFNDKYI